MNHFRTPLYATSVTMRPCSRSATIRRDTGFYAFLNFVHACKIFVASRRVVSELSCRFHGWIALCVVGAASFTFVPSASADINGVVTAWGNNGNGQCNIPADANSGVSAIAGGYFHTIALKAGTVLAWGYNGNGQCNIPAAANSGVSAIAGGFYHTIALSPIKDCNNNGIHDPFEVAGRQTDKVKAWGYNGDGQCTIPASANSGVSAIAGGGYHTIALKGGGGPAPTIASISPTSGSTLGGTTITIEGVNLLSVNSVTVGGVAATSVVVLSDTLITAVTPLWAEVGTIDCP